MSDGDKDATPGHRRAPSAHRDDEWNTANSPRNLGAAPWERFSAPPVDDGLLRWTASLPTEPLAPQARQDARDAQIPLDADAADDTSQAGSHIDGAVSVADLIAKLGA